MAARYWVGSSGGGVWSDPSKWSATSGGAGGASVPGSADTAIFDSVSGAGTATVDSNVTIQTLTMTGWTGTLAFGTNTISLNGTGAVYTGATTYSVTGTPLIKVITGGSTAIQVNSGSVTEANSISFEIIGGTYTFTATQNCRDLTFTGYSGNGLVRPTLYGNLTLSPAMTVSSSSTAALNFVATSGTKTITTYGLSFGCPINFDGVGGTWQLQDALTTSAIRAVTLTNGTLNLNNNTLTAGFFASNNANVRTLAFGSGSIVCNAAGGTLWTTAASTNLTVTGTPTVNISYSGALATSVLPGTLTEAQAISFNFTTGTYSLTFLATSNYAAKNVDFTGFAGTWAARTVASVIYGNLTISTGMTFAASSGVLNFRATSGTQILTSNGKTIDEPLTLNGVGGTLKLADALTMGATRTFNFNNGTFDGNGQTITGAALLSASSAGVTAFKNVNTAIAFTVTSSTATFASNITTGAFTLTVGSLDLGSYTLTAPTFFSSGSGVRTLNFGTGNITVVNTAGGTLWNTGTVNNMTVTGTPVANISNSGAVATTVFNGALPESGAISFNFINGTYDLALLSASGSAVKNVNFSGYAGTWLGRSTSAIIYGSLTLSSSASFVYGGSTGVLTFAATSGTQVITSNGKTFDQSFTINGVGGTVQLADALLMASSQVVTHTNGTLNLNGQTLTVGSSYTIAAGTKVLTFNGGTLVCPASTTSAFVNNAPTGFSTVAGTGTGKISMTGATAKTFFGNGSTYNCTLSNDGAGALTVNGANTFTSITNGVQPTQFIFTSGTTTTVTNWDVSGTAGNLVTITSTTSGAAATLSKASGTVSSNYLSLKDSSATGGAAWYAGANSTNVSGNLGWIFTAPPVVTAGGNFFFMF